MSLIRISMSVSFSVVYLHDSLHQRLFFSPSSSLNVTISHILVIAESPVPGERLLYVNKGLSVIPEGRRISDWGVPIRVTDESPEEDRGSMGIVRVLSRYPGITRVGVVSLSLLVLVPPVKL